MIKRNSANERVKRRYLQHLKETKGRDEFLSMLSPKRSIVSRTIPSFATSRSFTSNRCVPSRCI